MWWGGDEKKKKTHMGSTYDQCLYDTVLRIAVSAAMKPPCVLLLIKLYIFLSPVRARPLLFFLPRPSYPWMNQCWGASRHGLITDTRHLITSMPVSLGEDSSLPRAFVSLNIFKTAAARVRMKVHKYDSILKTLNWIPVARVSLLTLQSVWKSPKLPKATTRL